MGRGARCNVKYGFAGRKENNVKTLYVSDLDGTLLGSSAMISEYTCNVINDLTEQGMVFSYATARSLVTAKKVTRGLCAKIPLIVYNGAFIRDNVTEEILAANYFDETINDVLEDLFRQEVWPIVYSYVDGRERFSYIPEKGTKGVAAFCDSRKDGRKTAVTTPEALKAGNVFYVTCIDEPRKLRPLYEKYRDVCHCVYQKDVYTGEQWLELMPRAASKANAILQLKELSGCDRVVVFGDGKNDLDMFEVADEGYAVRNAQEELKEKATAVIGSNDEDGVARWLAQNVN